MHSTTTTFTDLYVEVQQHYAAQMQMLDGNDFAGYASTFTEDGEFAHTPGRPAAKTRPGIVAELEQFNTRFDGDPVQRRHWFTMINVQPQEDGTIHTVCYVLVGTIRPNAQPLIAPSCVVQDILVRVDGRLHNLSRRVDHDQLF
jgi:actinorhodin biosynthesis protein ActVIA